MKPDEKKKIFTALSTISQLGLEIVISLLLWIIIGKFLTSKFNLPNIIMLLSIFCGLGSAILSFYKFYKNTTDTKGDK